MQENVSLNDSELQASKEGNLVFSNLYQRKSANTGATAYPIVSSGLVSVHGHFLATEIFGYGAFRVLQALG
jgi:hypothetical protein